MRVIFGHKDFRDPNDTDTWTACPGSQVMARLGLITFAKEAPMPQPTTEQILAAMALFNEALEYARLEVSLKAETKAKIHWLTKPS